VIFDRPLHRPDLFLLLPDPEGQGGFDLLFRLVADRLHLVTFRRKIVVFRIVAD
jgi:hypothetical protein